MPLLFLFVILVQSVSAAETTLSYLTGKVEIDGVSATQHQIVKSGQVVHTGLNSTAIVEMADGSKLKLNSETEVKLERNPAAGELTLIRGAVFSRVKKQIQGRKFTLHTRAVTIGVRGTEFFTAFGKENAKGTDLWMCVNEGSVDVETLVDRKKSLVKAGEGVFVPAGKTITPPKAYEWTKKLNWNMQPETGDVIDHTKIDYKGLLDQEYD